MDRSLLRVVRALRDMGVAHQRQADESYRASFQRLAPAWLDSDAAAHDDGFREYIQRMLDRERRRHPRNRPSTGA